MWHGGRMRHAAVWCVAIVALSLIAACSSESDFPDPSNPVTGIPWPDYELLRYDIVDQTNVKLGTVDFEVERQEDEYRLGILFLNPSAQAQDEVELFVDAETLQALRYSRLATDTDDRIEVTGTYSVDEEGMPVLDSIVVENGDRKEKQVEVGDFGFDTDSSAWLWRSIAFAQDYEVSYRSVNTLAQRSQLVRLRVVGQDRIHTSVGDILAWQLEVRPGLERQNIWYEVDNPHVLVRWDLEPRRYLLREIHHEPLEAMADDDGLS